MLIVISASAPLLVQFTSCHHLVHPVEVFNSHKLFLEVVIEKLIVRTKREDLLLLQLPSNELVHLLLSQFALLEQQLDLSDCVGSVDIDLVFDHVQSSFKNTINFVGLPNFDLMRWLLVLNFLNLLLVL